MTVGGDGGSGLRGRADIVIIGGGVAGLWTRARLARAGYGVVLLESREIGGGQTVASQGILHSGVKYALSAEAREASGQLAAAQGVWREAIAGRGEVDLSGVEVLADRMHLWATGVLGKATGVAAALAMRSEVRRLEPREYPPLLAEAPAGLAVWEVDEVSVSARSLVSALADADDGPIVRTSRRGAEISMIERAGPACVRFEADVGPVGADERSGGGEPHTEAVEIDASAVVLAAGAGNEALIAGLGGDAPSITQRRPLHMLLVDGAPGPLFGHVPRGGSDKPRLTITSARTETGWCWSIGGDVAETGVGRTREEQIAFGQRELRECLGWVDLSQARWSAFRIDRAEGKTEDGRRPDGPVVRTVGAGGARGGVGDGATGASRIIAVWPTKLALAPVAAGMVADELERMGVRPAGAGRAGLDGLRGLSVPSVASPPWKWKELAWS